MKDNNYNKMEEKTDEYKRSIKQNLTRKLVSIIITSVVVLYVSVIVVMTKSGAA